MTSILHDDWLKKRGCFGGQSPIFSEEQFHLSSEGWYGDVSSSYIIPPWFRVINNEILGVLGIRIFCVYEICTRSEHFSYSKKNFVEFFFFLKRLFRNVVVSLFQKSRYAFNIVLLLMDIQSISWAMFQ